MISLDEAIKHAEEVAEEHTKYNIYGGFESCDECAKEHRQLAEWLRELKAYKEQTDGDLISRTELLNKIWQKEYGKDYDGVNMLDIPHIDIIENMPSADGDLKAEIDKLPRIKVGNSNSPTVKYCIDERLLYEILEKMKGE